MFQESCEFSWNVQSQSEWVVNGTVDRFATTTKNDKNVREIGRGFVRGRQTASKQRHHEKWDSIMATARSVCVIYINSRKKKKYELN
jgi:hypothetical protein